MLFNLSSNGEPDPAKFKNSFSNTITIEPDSHICLISASIIEDLSSAVITIGANTTMNLRFDAFNVFQQIINVNETSYTLINFVAHLNTLFSAKICLNRRFFAKLADTATGDLAVAFTMYNTDDNDTNWMRYVMPTNTITADQNPDQASNWLMGQFAGNIADPNTAIAKGDMAEFSDNVFGCFVNAPTGGNYLWVFDSNLQNTLSGSSQEYQQPNQVNKETTQPLVGFKSNDYHYAEDVNNDDWTWSAVTIANPPTWERGRDINTSNSVILFSNPSFTAGNLTKYGDTNYIDIVFDGEGNAVTQLLNVDSGSQDTVNTGKYALGDQYRIWLGSTTANNAASIPGIKKYSWDGLVAWIPNQLEWTTGTGATAKVWNVRSILPYPAVNLMYKQVVKNSQADFNTQFDSTTTKRGGSNSMMGCWLSNGFNDRVYDGHGHCFYRDNGLSEAMTDISYPGNYSQFTKDCVQFARVDSITPEPPTPTSSKRNILELRDELDTRGATMISCLVYFKNDNAVVTGTGQYLMTALGGYTYADAPQQVISFEINPSVSGAVFDVGIRDSAGSPTNISLTNGATPIDIQYDQWYHFVYVDGGSNAFRIDMTNIDTGDVFTGGGNHTNIGLGLIQTIGGAVSDNDPAFSGAEYYMFGHVMDFRFYSTPYYAARLLTDYDTTITQLRNGYVNGTNEPALHGRPTTTLIYGALENKYASIPQPSTDIDDTVSMMLQIDGLRAVDVPKAIFHFTDPWIPQNIKIPFTQRNRFMPERALSGIGNGLVEAEALEIDFNFDNYDAANERVILPYSLTPDGINNPFFNEVAEVGDLELQDETFSVEVTNLPHRSYNGKNRSTDKTIYVLPVEQGIEKNNLKIVEHSPHAKVWIPLNNAGNIPLNELAIQISKENGTKADNLQPDTHLSIQIETRENRI